MPYHGRLRTNAPPVTARAFDTGRRLHRLRAMAYPDFLLDKRVVHRNIAKGLVDMKTLSAHLKGLPDVESNAEPCTPEPEVVDADAATDSEAETSDT